MLKKAIVIGFVLAFFASCHNKLEINAPYKQSICVYGLLNPDDTVNYIRVQRIFLGEGNALVMAQNPDSTYFKPGELKVTLQRIKNGAQVSVDNPSTSNMEIVLTEQYVPLNTGTFNVNQLLYKTNHALYTDCDYRLVVHNNKTGADFTSKDVHLIDDFSSSFAYATKNSILTLPHDFRNIFPSGTNGKVVCMYGSPFYAGVCGCIMRFFYTEYYNLGPSQSKYVDIDVGRQYTASPLQSEVVDLSYDGTAMLSSVNIAIGVAPNINHRTADSVHFIVNAAGEELALYNQVNTTTTLSQEKPYYTNINGGAGILSSRREYTIRKQLYYICIDRIANDPISCHLRFYNDAGSLTTSCP